MASCSLGVSNIKLLNLNFGRLRLGKIQPQFGARTWTSERSLQPSGLVISRHLEKSWTVCSASSSEAESASKLGDASEETKSSSMISQLIPDSYEVESLLTAICDTTSIAEFEMKLCGFHLRVIRDLNGKTSPPSSFPPVSIDTTAKVADSNGSVSTPSLAISKPVPSSGSGQSFLDTVADEGLVILPSPRVGFFRRSRTIKGKRAPPSCKEKQIVKEGQVLCYIEQLGGEIPIESDISGEVIKILREDGDPVGYGDALITILPSFPGIKKLQ